MKIFQNNQFGRSMVEMLGVLAIIGVLSVGAIAGYSKAMFKYKMNKTMDIMTHVFSRLVEFENMELGTPLDTDISGAQGMKKYGILPDCETVTPKYSSHSEACALPLGNIDMYVYNTSDTNLLAAKIFLEFDKDSVDSCIAFMTSAFYKNTPIDWWNYNGTTLDGPSIKVGDYNIFFPYEGTFEDINLITNEDILNACNMCGSTCLIELVIRDYY